MPKLSKRDYQLSFIALVKAFVTNDITLEGYKESLGILLQNYRKDYKNGNAS